MSAINVCWSQDFGDLGCDPMCSLSVVSNTKMGRNLEFSPLLAWFGSLAFEGASGPLLELGWRLLVNRSSNSCVCHPSFVFLKQSQD